MTVRELMEKLSAFDPELPVVTGGFDESGFDPVARVQDIEVVQVNKHHGHAGLYEEPRPAILGTRQKRLGKPFKAVFLDW